MTSRVGDERRCPVQVRSTGRVATIRDTASHHTGLGKQLRQPHEIERRARKHEQPIDLRQPAQLHLPDPGDRLQPAERWLDTGSSAPVDGIPPPSSTADGLHSIDRSIANTGPGASRQRRSSRRRYHDPRATVGPSVVEGNRVRARSYAGQFPNAVSGLVLLLQPMTPARRESNAARDLHRRLA